MIQKFIAIITIRIISQQKIKNINIKLTNILQYLLPLGGSFVIFTLACNTLTGNCAHGIDVNHNLKSLWILSGVKFSTIFSNSGSHDMNK